MSHNKSTTLADEGFLSDETAEVIETVRMKYEPWSSKIRVLNELLVRGQYGITIHIQNAREIVSAALFMRVLVHSQASVLLIERGMASSARAMARCALEALFCLGACVREPARALVFVDADELDKVRSAKHLTEVVDTQTQETVAKFDLKKILADAQRRITELGAKKITAFDMAKAADLKDMYLTAYDFLSGAVHSSSRDIEQHFQVDNAGNLHALINEPVLEGLDMLYLILGEILVVCGRFLGEVFGFNTTECEASMARLHTLWEKHAC